MGDNQRKIISGSILWVVGFLSYNYMKNIKKDSKL